MASIEDIYALRALARDLPVISNELRIMNQLKFIELNYKLSMAGSCEYRDKALNNLYSVNNKYKLI